MNNEIKLKKGKETVTIYQDELYDDDPNKWDNGVILVNYHRDFTMEKNDVIIEENVKDWYLGEKIPQSKDYYIFQLSCLIHSGVWLSLNYSFDCDAQGWDTSHVGAILVKKTEAKSKKDAYKIAESTLKIWNDLLSGSVYGFTLEKEVITCKHCNSTDQKMIESIGGFIGDFTGMLDYLPKKWHKDIKEARF